MNKEKDKLLAAEWAFKLLKRPFYILDTETTGKDPFTNEVVQISIIDEKGQTVFSSLVKPKGKVDPGAEKVHGKTAEVLANAPTWDQIYPQLCELLKDKLVICYNEWYDHGIINHTNAVYGLPEIDCEWDCAMKAYAQFNGQWNDRHHSYTFIKLTEAIKSFGLEVENAHDALGDVLMTLSVIHGMARHYVVNSLNVS